MVVMTPREKWSDERLDDLSKKVDDGFARVDSDIRELRADMTVRFDKVDARFGEIDARFESLNRTLLGAAIALIVALIGCTSTLAAVALS
jgi:hypothetical protein